MAEINNKQTPFEAEKERLIKRVLEYKRIAEVNIVTTIYKQPDLFFKNHGLTRECFDDDAAHVYFTIAHGILDIEGKTTLDACTVGFYLEKHPKLRAKFDEYGGYDIINAKAYVDVKNFNAYVLEFHKWQAVKRLAKQGFIDDGKLSHYADISSEDIHNEIQEHVDLVFKDIMGKNKVYNGFEGLSDLVNELDEGVGAGLPFYNAPLLTKEINGIKLGGNIYGLGAASGVGKSTMAFNYILPSIMSNNEKVVFIINEESHTKFQTELLLLIANNHCIQDPQKYIQKSTLLKGHFDPETKAILEKAANMLEKHKEHSQFRIIPLEQYSIKAVIHYINQYAAQGVKLFVLDTFKESCDAATDDIYKSMTRDMVDLYDTVKPEARNVSLFITYQISKGSLNARHLTNGDVGQAKSIVDVMAVNLMMRRPFSDEFKGGSKEVKCWREKDGQKKEFSLQPGKQYMITFIAKNRFGKMDDVQIVSECDLGTNVHRDIGYCKIA